MSTVLWVNYLKDNNVESDEFDLHQLYRHAAKVDKLCKGIGVRKLSDFHDNTDMLVNMGMKQCPEDKSTYDLMVEEGNWFNPSEGLLVVDKLVAELTKNPVRFGFISNKYQELIAELEHCRASIQKALDNGVKFNLGIVM